jgi:hypothetical protein
MWYSRREVYDGTCIRALLRKDNNESEPVTCRHKFVPSSSALFRRLLLFVPNGTGTVVNDEHHSRNFFPVGVNIRVMLYLIREHHLNANPLLVSRNPYVKLMHISPHDSGLQSLFSCPT